MDTAYWRSLERYAVAVSAVIDRGVLKQMTVQAETKSVLWKIIQFPLVRIVIAIVWLSAIFAGALSLLELLPVPKTPVVSSQFLNISALIMFLSYYAFVRIIEKRPVNEFGKIKCGREIASGFLVGAALFSTSILILWAIGCYRVTGLNPWTVAIYPFIDSFFGSVFQDVLWIGAFLRIIEQWIGTWIALFISALGFGLLHLMTPELNLTAALMIALEGGVLLAAAYILTRRLWFAIGIHFSYSFVESGIFGGNVALENMPTIFESTFKGPVLLSGGKYGAESSIVTFVVCTIAGFILLWMAKKKGNFIR